MKRVIFFHFFIFSWLLNSTVIDSNLHRTVIVSEGFVYLLGADFNGKLTIEPKLIDGLENIKSVAMGNYHILALDYDGNVFSFGRGTSGQLGHGDDVSLEAPTRIGGLNKIAVIAAKRDYSMVCDEHGDVFVFGDGSSGQFGKTGNIRYLLPTKVQELENITNISAAGFYSLALDKRGDVWVLGILQVGPRDQKSTVEIVYTPRQVPGLRNILAIAANYSNVFALDTKGRLWEVGDAKYGRIVVGEKASPILYPRVMDGPRNVKEIAVGEAHVVILTDNGQVWTAGDGYWGETGRRKDFSCKPNEVTNLGKITKIFAAGSASIVVGDEEKCEYFGIFHNCACYSTTKKPFRYSELLTPHIRREKANLTVGGF